MKRSFLFLYLLIFCLASFAQSVAINTDGTSANGTAILDVKSTNKGILPPRMTQAQRDAITSPASGLIIHCTDCSRVGPYAYNGSAWMPMLQRTYSVGDAAQGGIVFWVDDTGEHGLVAATADQSTNSPWMPSSGSYINKVRNDGIKTGRINTDLIIAYYGVNVYAAQVCAQYLGGGYGDWYLPSKYELNLLYLQKTTVGGFVGSIYWSSTELDALNAWYSVFSDGSQFAGGKTGFWSVRAIRRF